MRSATPFSEKVENYIGQLLRRRWRRTTPYSQDAEDAGIRAYFEEVHREGGCPDIGCRDDELLGGA